MQDFLGRPNWLMKYRELKAVAPLHPLVYLVMCTPPGPVRQYGVAYSSRSALPQDTSSCWDNTMLAASSLSVSAVEFEPTRFSATPSIPSKLLLAGVSGRSWWRWTFRCWSRETPDWPVGALTLTSLGEASTCWARKCFRLFRPCWDTSGLRSTLGFERPTLYLISASRVTNGGPTVVPVSCAASSCPIAACPPLCCSCCWDSVWDR
mmetsp:Transcript_36412/g.87565  ORF Transcript_36412/g.87565 Transcript_36412/m.87565 type:complete len:207 (+) Transcript_36412:988-1608(+)